MKNLIAISLGVVVGLTSIAGYADRYSLGTVQVQPDGNEGISLSSLKDKFIYDITCNIVNHGDTGAAIKVSQRYNDFGAVTLNGESLNKINARTTAQGRLDPSMSVLIIHDLNDNSGFFSKDYLNFSRSPSTSKRDIDISCSAEPSHNPSIVPQ